MAGRWRERSRLARLARQHAERAGVPTAVLFNEAQSMDQVRCALASGCNAVMLDSSGLPYQDNMAVTAQVVAAAHAAGAAVEAELGHLMDAVDPHGQPAVFTDPSEAARFVERTGVDALAVSIGNAHIVMSGEVDVDLDLLAGIHQAVAVPLVIHGGSGFPRAAVRGAIAAGAAKFNVGTVIKGAYLEGIRAALPDPSQVHNIHAFVGSREADDVLRQAKEAMKAKIVELMELYGSAGQADAY